uniref:DUF7734 domain-containing protein n=1 Tax=Puya raimondii TaxID=112807 RepID=A0A8A0WIU1_PUYRA|nr:hypothetical protein PY_026437 [Puya raimondii]
MLIHCYALPLPHTSPPILRSAVIGKSAPSSAYKRKNTAPTTRARRDYYYSGCKNINVVLCGARRRARYEEEDGGGGGGEEEYGHNDEIALLESYSESARDEALLVTAAVDGDDEVVLVFKGFSSCLSSRTAADPSKSVLPARAVIQSIDVVRGPFDPNNIQYLEKGLTWEAFRSRLQQPKKL